MSSVAVGGPGGTGRSGRRTASGLAAVIAGAVPFLALVVLVRSGWGPLHGLDRDVAAELNTAVSRHPALVDALGHVSDAGGSGASAAVLFLTAAWLFRRGSRRLAAYVVVTGVGLAALVPVTKTLVGRDRPTVSVPVAELPADASFPSGHAMCSLVTYGLLVLVTVSRMPRARWVALTLAASVVVLVVGFTRIALGVHFVTDVLAGYALGAMWLAVTTAAFRPFIGSGAAAGP